MARLPATFVLIAWLLPAASALFAQDLPVSAFNGKQLREPGADRPLRFYLFGHLYGDPASHSVMPSGTFLAAAETINADSPDLLISLGDSFRFARHPYLSNALSLFNRLQAPVFNAVGNHELTGGPAAYERFGPRYQGFRLQGCQFLILDSEVNGGQLGEEQRAWLFDQLERVKEDDSVQNLFLFSHRLTWAASHPEMEVVFANVNNTVGYIYRDFGAEIEPRLKSVAEAKSVYWFSGDIGVSWSFSLFHYRDPELPLSYVATGLGNTAEDAMIRVDVGKDGRAELTAIPLAGQTEFAPLETYDLDFWRERFADNGKVAPEPRTAPSLLDRFTGMFARRSFYVGVALGGLVVLLGVWLRSRRKASGAG